MVKSKNSWAPYVGDEAIFYFREVRQELAWTFVIQLPFLGLKMHPFIQALFARQG